MAIPFKLKRSSVVGKIPDSSDLVYGELALNYADGKLYFKNSSNNIRSFLDSGQIINLIDSAYVQARQSATGGGGGASVTTSTTPPGSPSDGDLWFDENDGTLSVYYNDGTSSQWVIVSGPLGDRATVTTSTTPPVSANDGELWFDENDGTLSVYYNDGTSSQWVVVSSPAPVGLDSSDIITLIDSAYVQSRQITGINTGKAIAMAMIFG